MKLRKINSILFLACATLMVGCSNQEATTESQPVEQEVDSSVVEPVEDQATASYPITIEHAFGETVIENEPERVVTISWGNQDVPLALGVVPVGVSKVNYGKIDENGLLPWSTNKYEELGVHSPVVFDDTDGLDFEAISDANPDVILASYSGLTQEEYELLSQIAPVVAYPTFAWQTYWRDQIVMNATGMGKQVEGEELVEQLNQMIEEKSQEHPELDGKTAAFFYFNTADLGSFYIYLPTDPRAAYLEDLGLSFPESVKALAEDVNSFTVQLSAENIDLLTDIDVIVTYGDETVLEALQADTLVGTIPAIERGSVVLMDNDSTIAASCTPTALSIPATIEEYLDLLGEAADKVQ